MNKQYKLQICANYCWFIGGRELKIELKRKQWALYISDNKMRFLSILPYGLTMQTDYIDLIKRTSLEIVVIDSRYAIYKLILKLSILGF